MTNNVYEKMFLYNGLTFMGIDDLYKRIKKIRLRYIELDKDIKIVYKWYFFCQLCLLHKADYLKSAMWTYITSSDASSENDYEKVIEKYEVFNERRNSLFKSKNWLISNVMIYLD